MLGDREAFATIAVRDLTAARAFYEGRLGLRPLPGPEMGAIAYASGSSTVLVYESRFAGTNKATAATWKVGDDVKGVARALAAKGVRFEHYDLPDTTRDGDVHLTGDIRVAWFKDPDGNILSIVNG
jgi:catechol 2,3-dioxygenase-like lactoylglutathione lyase family enzyme